MTGLHLNAAHDLDFDGGHLELATGREAITQHVEQRLRTFHGEWFLDVGAGVPWLTELMGAAFRERAVTALIRAETLDTPGVTGVGDIPAAFATETRIATARVLDLDFAQ